MPFFSADQTTLTAIFAEDDDDSKRTALKTRLGTGTITMRIFNENNTQVVTGTFAGSSLSDLSKTMLNNVQITDVSGAGGTPNNFWTLSLENSGDCTVIFGKDSWSYVGPNGSPTINTADDFYLTLVIGQAVVVNNFSDVYNVAVTPDPGYSPTTPPSNAVTTLMTPSDTPIKLGRMSHGWHRYNNFTFADPYTIPHQRLWDWWPASSSDDLGCMWARIFRTGRTSPDRARFDEAIADNGGCPKILPVHPAPAWAIAQSHIDEVRARYGQENQFGQIHGPTRYPSYPYSFGPLASWTYLAEYIEWIYTPADQLCSIGILGAGKTPEQIPVIEFGNEQKFGAKVPNTSSRYWDYEYAGNPPRAFNLMTPGEMAIAVRIIKENVPAGVQVWIGGWEGDYNGKTLSNPSAQYSFFQAWALSSDGAGGLGIDHVDCVPFHPYMYGYDPQRVQTEINGYRAQLEWLANHLGRPSLATLPIHANETGHQNSNGDNLSYGSVTYLRNTQPSTWVSTIARDMMRTFLYCAGNASRKQVWGITHYKDAPTFTTNGQPNGSQTYGTPAENQGLINQTIEINGLVGKVVRQAYILSDGQVWVEFEDGTIKVR